MALTLVTRLLYAQQSRVQIHFRYRYYFHLRKFFAQRRQEFLCVAYYDDAGVAAGQMGAGKLLYIARCNSLNVCDVTVYLVKADAIYPATVVGKPRQEDFFIGDYLQKLLSPLFPLVMPTVRDLWTYGETGFHSLCAAVVRERYGREALVSAFRILGEGQLSLTKFLLLTDTPQDLHDFPRLLEHVLARFNPETDLFIFSNVSMDTLDYTSGKVNEGSKAVMLGLGEARRDLLREFRGPLPAGVSFANVFCAGCLVVQGSSYTQDPGQAARIANETCLAEWQLVILHDNASVASSTPDFLWSTWTRLEPAGNLVNGGCLCPE